MEDGSNGNSIVSAGTGSAMTQAVIAGQVVMLRGLPCLLNSAVAEGFGVETREITQAIRRNPKKFREEHAFELTPDEVKVLTSQGVIPKRKGRGGSSAVPWAITQKGVARLATVLNSEKALEATDLIIDVFVEVYQQVASGK